VQARHSTELWVHFILCCLILCCLFVATAIGEPAPAEAQQIQSPSSQQSHPDTSSSPQTAAPSQGPAPAPGDDTATIQEEVGDRDPTYLRTRVLFRYDYKAQEGDASINRFRFKLQYAFGPRQRFGLSVLAPVIHKGTPDATAAGSGDTELVAGANLYRTERFRTGVSFQVTFQTSSDDLVGGATTTIKPAWGFTAVLSSRLELVSAFYYKQSIHTIRGAPVKQFEPDIFLNIRVRRTTWWVEWDSFYDLIPQQFAQTMKTGLSRSFGPNRQWVASAYCGLPLNRYGRQTQYHVNPGLDVTWYPFKNK
jgi:hypothetical protein